MLLCLCDGTIEIIAFIILLFKHMAISSVNKEEPPYPVHHGFSVRKISFLAQQDQSCREMVIPRTDE